MSDRLDKRGCLYGEPRLSDQQVRALRAADASLLHRQQNGQWWAFGGACKITGATIASIDRLLLVEVDYIKGEARSLPRGRKILAAIEAA